MACKGRCDKYSVSAPFGKKYANGFKRCSVCDIYIKWSGKYCPCCNHQLRTTPSSAKNKREYRKAKKIKIENFRIN